MKPKKNPAPNQEKRRVTQADLARLAGVSAGVVSAALYDSAKGVIRVSPAVVKKIKALAKQEGYTPNHAARQPGRILHADPTTASVERLLPKHNKK